MDIEDRLLLLPDGSIDAVGSVLNVAYGKDSDWKVDFVLNHYKYLLKNRFKFTKELNSLFKPTVRFV